MGMTPDSKSHVMVSWETIVQDREADALTVADVEKRARDVLAVFLRGVVYHVARFGIPGPAQGIVAA